MVVKNWNEAISRLSELKPDLIVNPNNLALAADAVLHEGWLWDQMVIQKYWVYYWYCTDSWAGLAIYTLFGNVVAVSSKRSRKSDEVVEFISIEAARTVREYLLSLIPEKVNVFPVANLDEEIDPGWFERI